LIWLTSSALVDDSLQARLVEYAQCLNGSERELLVAVYPSDKPVS